MNLFEYDRHMKKPLFFRKFELKFKSSPPQFKSILGMNCIIDKIFKVIEKCTNFYFRTEKLPPKF